MKPTPSETPATEREPDQVALGYEINEALGSYLDATEGIQKHVACVKLQQILWDNKAGIIAGLLNGANPAVADVRAKVIEEAVSIAHEWADKMAKNNGRETANTIADRIRALQQQAGDLEKSER